MDRGDWGERRIRRKEMEPRRAGGLVGQRGPLLSRSLEPEVGAGQQEEMCGERKDS